MRAILMIAALLACATPGAATASLPDAAIGIDNFAFAPAEITIPAGTTVVWTNRDDIPHTVVAADPPRRFKSGPLDTGDHYAFRFDTPGRYAFFCSLHAHMQGLVIVK